MKSVIVLLTASLSIASVSAQTNEPASSGPSPTTATPLSCVMKDDSAWVVAAKPAAGRKVVVNDVDPFTHTALIPAASDLSSIRFRRIKEVKVPTGRRLITDTSYCEDIFRKEPSGSVFSPLIQEAAFTRAFQVTYSFEGPPLASDEYGDRHFTFDVYFRPEELSRSERDVLLPQKRLQKRAAELFRFSTSTASETRSVIDGENSKFCEGTYIDGAWVHHDRECRDDVKIVTIAVPSEYVTVRVDVAASGNVSSDALLK